jgi:putative peptidoglycan lipid II flippase
VEAISGVLLGGIVTSVLPLVSMYAAEGDIKKMKSSILDAVRLIAFFALPIAAWLIFVSKPMIILVFAHGRFSSADAATIAFVIALLTPYVVFGRIIGIAQTPFYAKLDTRTPLISVVLYFVMYVGLVVLLHSSLGLYAFPIASSVSCAVTAVTMSILLNRAFGPLGWVRLKAFGTRMGVAMLAMVGGLAAGTSLFTSTVIPDTLLAKAVRFALPTALGTAMFLVGGFSARLISLRHVRYLFPESSQRETPVQTVG